MQARWARGLSKAGLSACSSQMAEESYKSARASGSTIQGAANLQAMVPVMQKFALGPATSFEVARGLNRMPATAAMLRPGQRIIVQAQGDQAIGVQIIASGANGGARRGVYHAARRPGVVRGNGGSELPSATSAPRGCQGGCR